MADNQQSVATVNGKTVTVKKWIAYVNLTFTVISLLAVGISYIVSPIIWKAEVETAMQTQNNKIESQNSRIEILEKWRDLRTKEIEIDKREVQMKLQEIALNQRMTMRKLGIEYETDVR